MLRLSLSKYVCLRPGLHPSRFCCPNQMAEPDEQTLRRIAHDVARKYAQTGWARVTATEYEDLAQIAFLGAWRAHFRYDAAKGCRYSTWLWDAAAGEVRHYLRDHACIIRPSRKVWDHRIGDPFLVPQSLDLVHDGKDGNPFDSDAEQFSDPRVDIERDVALRDLLRRLPLQLAQVVWLYYGEGWSQTEIAHSVGISQKHVSRRLRQGLTKLQALAS